MGMSALAEKIRRARQRTVEADGRKFVIQRPTDADAMFRLSGLDAIDVLKRFVIDWPGMTELDLGIPGGSPVEVAFDPEAFGAWVEDQPRVLQALTDALTEAYKAHAETLKAAEKN